MTDWLTPGKPFDDLQGQYLIQYRCQDNTGTLTGWKTHGSYATQAQAEDHLSRLSVTFATFDSETELRICRIDFTTVLSAGVSKHKAQYKYPAINTRIDEE